MQKYLVKFQVVLAVLATQIFLTELFLRKF